MTPDCTPPDDRPVDLLRYKWTVPVVTTLAEDGHRFNELKRAIDDPPSNVLAERLKQLEAAGVVSRSVRETTPPSVRYELTERGRALAELVEEIERL